MATATPPPRAPLLSPAIVALTLVAAAGLVAQIWLIDYLPTHDGPQHVFLGHVGNHFADAGAGYDRFLERGHPLTALGFYGLFSTFERLLPWRSALRAALTVIVLVWGTGHLAFSARLHPRRAALGLLGFATAVSWSLHMGFFSYCLSMGMAFWILALAVPSGDRGAPAWSPLRRVLLGALLTATGVVHIFGAQVAGLGLLAMVLATATPSRRLRELGLLAAMGAPCVLLLMSAESPAVETTSTTWLDLGQHLTTLPRTFLPGPLWRTWPPVLAGIAGCALALRVARRAWPTLSMSERAAVGLASSAAALLALGLTAPLHLPRWEFFSPRFLAFGVLGGASFLPLERLSKAGHRAAVAGLSLFTAASLGWGFRASSDLRARSDEALSGLAAPVHRSGPRLILALDPSAGLSPEPGSSGEDQLIPFLFPLRNLGSLYAVSQGGIPPYSFVTSPALHPFVLSAEGRRRYPPLFDERDQYDPKITSDPEVRRSFITFVAAVGVPFEDIVLAGRPEDGDVLATRGYVADFRNGGLFVGHLEGCPITVEIDTPAPRPEAIFAEVTFPPLPSPAAHQVFPPEPAGREGALRFTPSVPLCGPAAVRVVLDRDRSGSPSPGDVHCDGAGPDGFLPIEAKRGAVVVCRLPR